MEKINENIIEQSKEEIKNLFIKAYNNNQIKEFLEEKKNT